MCGRFTLASDIGEFLASIGIRIPEDLAHPREYNIAPSLPVVGVVADPTPRLEIMEWGFIPSWASPQKEARPVINARVESIREKKPYFRGAFNSGRCAIIADGFYEWKKVAGGGKQPYRIGLDDGSVFAMAGLWSATRTADGSERPTCAIVTVEPNELMKDIHNRMPAMLLPQDLAVWLDPKGSERDLFAALAPYPASQMRAVRVSPMVNNPRNNTVDCIRSIDD